MPIRVILWVLHSSRRIKNENREREKNERDKGYRSVITTRCHFFSLHSFSRQLLRIIILKSISFLSDHMNTTTIFDNKTFSSTTTTRTFYVKNPFDSWYIGGLLFMLTVILVLLYANYYRENTFQILWIRLLIKLHIIPPLSQTTPSSSHPAMNTLLI